MKIELVYWVLYEEDCSTDSLNTLIDDACLSRWRDVENLKEKVWFEDAGGQYWGALMIWDGDKPPLDKLPQNAPKEIIGREPDRRLSFNVVSKI